MQVETISLLAGAILLVSALLGGGIRIKEIEIPQIGLMARWLSGVFGIALIALGVWLNVRTPDVLHTPPVSKSSGISGITSSVKNPASVHEEDVFDEWVIQVGRGTEKEMYSLVENFAERYHHSGDERWNNDIFKVRDPEERGMWMVVIDTFQGESSEEAVTAELLRLKGLKSIGASKVELPLSEAKVIKYSEHAFRKNYGF